MKNSPFEQNIIAMVWDCDKTLIDKYMQEPLFRYFGVDSSKFWREVNALKDFYAREGISVNADTSYLNHVLTYVNEGIFNGLNNSLLRKFGEELSFYPGLPEFFGKIKAIVEENPDYRKFDIRLEHYVVSTGFAETIRGSAIAPYVDGIFGSEFIENVALPGFCDSPDEQKPRSCEIRQVASALDNTSKTRYIFEINKGTNNHPDTIDVNSTIARESRRVPFENMVYIADGPSDVPAFSIMNYNGGATFAVYPKGDVNAFKQVDALRRDGRVQMFGEADYTECSQSYLWLTERVRSIAERIVEVKKAAIRNSAVKPPSHLN